MRLSVPLAMLAPRHVAPRALAAFSLVAVALVASLPACHRDEAAASQPPKEAAPLLRVQTATVAERPMPEYLVLTGSLRADQESNIAADANGKVLQLLVERGQLVKRGQVIATLDARAAALGATAAQAQAKFAQSQLDQSQRECERVKHLLDTAAISQAEYERQTAQCTAQQWSAAAAEAQQQSATKLLGDTSIRAPFDGIIGERMVNVGQYVQPSTQVASIYDPDPLRLQVTVPEANLREVTAGTPVTFAVAAFGDERFKATVKYVSPNVREATRDLVVEAIAPNPEGRLRPGMFAVARLELSERPHAVVPTLALKRDDTEARVFVVGPSKEVQERLVQLGETKGDVVTVLAGVKAGEAVVLQPGPDVRDGAHVE
jgi:membrane fusion protein (multidrug efflux system)